MFFFLKILSLFYLVTKEFQHIGKIQNDYFDIFQLCFSDFSQLFFAASEGDYWTTIAGLTLSSPLQVLFGYLLDRYSKSYIIYWSLLSRKTYS